MRLSEYRNQDATGLAELVRGGQVTPIELLELSMAAIEREDRELNAIANRLYDRATTQIRTGLAAGPFTGVPFMLKDLLAAYAGAPLTSGSKFCRGLVANEHSELVRRFIAAGLVVLAQTRSAEFGLYPVTEYDGEPTRNPWAKERTAGGSSGGSGAAVASGMVPMASGGDGGGSIRIPASCCGLFGLKPTRGRTPSGSAGEVWEGFAQEHVLTRSVRDSAAVLDVSNQPEAVSPYATRAPETPFVAALEAAPKRLRIGYSTRPVLGTETHPDCVRAVEDTASLLRDLGHEVVEAHFATDRREFIEGWLSMMAGQVAADVRDAARTLERKPHLGAFGRKTYLTYLIGEALPAASYVDAVRALKQVGRKFGLFLTGYDAWLTPTLGAPAAPHGAFELGPLLRFLEGLVARAGAAKLVLRSGQMFEAAAPMFEFVSYTPLANAGGQPSMTVPLFWNASDLPIGVMFTARFGEDALLLALARELEKARPWFHRQPPA